MTHVGQMISSFNSCHF